MRMRCQMSRVWMKVLVQRVQTLEMGPKLRILHNVNKLIFLLGWEQ